MARAMKDSGVAWIGEIPENWKIRKIKFVFRIKKDISGKEGYTVLSITQKGIKPKDLSKNEGQIAENYSNYQLVNIGDFAMNHMDLLTGSVDISKFEGVTSPDYRVFNFIESEKYDAAYYLYFMQMCYTNRIFYGFGQGVNGMGRWRLQADKFLNFTITVPELKEQQLIADFLDRKCSEIDAVLTKTRESIEEYKKLKQSIITQAVTKGIRPNRKMKDSGIEWIGEIPEDWEIKRLKFASKTRNEKYSQEYGILDYFGLENIESLSSRYIETENVYDISQSQICKKNDVAFGKLRPYLAKVYEVPQDGCCSSEFAVFYNFEGINTYFKYLFLSYGFITIVDASTYGAKMPRANIDFIRNMVIPVPNVTEQKEICNYLDKKCIEIDNLISKKKQLIPELESYKKSLIYEYVTGKKEVK